MSKLKILESMIRKIIKEENEKLNETVELSSQKAVDKLYSFCDRYGIAVYNGDDIDSDFLGAQHEPVKDWSAFIKSTLPKGEKLVDMTRQNYRNYPDFVYQYGKFLYWYNYSEGQMMILDAKHKNKLLKVAEKLSEL